MSSDDQQPPGSNVIDFGRRTGLTGFNLTPIPATTPGALGPVIPAQPDPQPGNGIGERVRRSPLDTLAALPSPVLTAPPVTTGGSPAAGASAASPSAGIAGTVGPGLGALSMGAVLAVAVAALRGSVTLIEDRRQQRMAREMEQAPLRAARLKHQLAMTEHGYSTEEAAAKAGLDAQKANSKHANAMQGLGAKSAEQRAKQHSKVPSGPEFGRKALGSRSGGGAGGAKGKGTGGGSGAGSGRSRGSKGGLGGKTGPGLGSKGLSGSKTGSKGSGLGSGGRGSGSKKNAGSGLGLKTSGTGGGSGSKKNRGSGSGSGLGLGGGTSKKDSKTDGIGSSSAKDKGGKKAPHRTSQGAGHGLGTGSGGRNRKERAAARQDGRLQRKADRQAARLGEHAKDKAAARDRKSAPKQARQDRKSRIRDARAEAKEARREKVRQDKFDAKQHQRAVKADANRAKKDEARRAKEKAAKADDDRTKLWDAFKNDTADTLGDRWTKRGTRVPPLWKNDKKRAKKTKTPKPPKGTTRPGRKGKRHRARDRARDAWGGFGGATPPPTGNPGTTGGPRRSPYGNAAHATNTSEPPTHEWAHHTPRPADATPTGAISRGTGALPPAPEPHIQRPGTSRPKEPIPMPPATAPVPSQDPRLVKARNQAARRAGAVTAQARHMDAQHATEITLDDALDEYGDFKDDAFKTHAQCSKLSGRARKLASTLERFAEELAVSNNLIGILFTGAMANLSESMELLAAMADEMEISSLEAAEMSESADNDLNDAYRPISQATADAGLSTPSAPVHNQT